MGLAAVVLEEYAGRTVELRHDHTLGSVDDEGTGGRHERNLAHIDFLLFHFLDRRLGCFLVHDRQAHLGAQRRSKGQAALLTFLDVERRHAERVADELEARILGMALDRENAGERRLQAFILAPVGRRELLQERGKRLNLGRQQIRHLQDAFAFRETLTDALLFGE